MVAEIERNACILLVVKAPAKQHKVRHGVRASTVHNTQFAFIGRAVQSKFSVKNFLAARQK
jgi:hypothetical protein